MNINPQQLYKVLEFDTGLVIVPQSAHLHMPNTVGLIVADFATCGEYLARYCSERMSGKDQRAAHKWALRGAKVLKAGDLDKPVGHG